MINKTEGTKIDGIAGSTEFARHLYISSTELEILGYLSLPVPEKWVDTDNFSFWKLHDE